MARRWLTSQKNIRGEDIFLPLPSTPGFADDGMIDQLHRADGTLDEAALAFEELHPDDARYAAALNLGAYQTVFPPLVEQGPPYQNALYFPPSRRGGRIARATDWATVTTIDSAQWGQQVWSEDPNCGGVWTEAHHCDMGCSGAPCMKHIVPPQQPPCSPLPCPDGWWPFSVHRCVTGNPWQHTAAQMDASGFGRLEAWMAREALRVAYTGMVSGGPIGNPYITMQNWSDNDADDAELVDWNITPASGPVPIGKGIAALSSALSCCQPDSAGLILVPQAVLDADVFGSVIYQDSIGRWRTRSGHAVVGDCAFDGRSPGNPVSGCGPAGTTPPAGGMWLYAVGSIDILLGRAFSPQRLIGAFQDPLFRDGFGQVQAPMSYGVFDANGVFQNQLRADYMINAAVAFSGCCRFAIQVQDRCCGDCD